MPFTDICLFKLAFLTDFFMSFYVNNRGKRQIILLNIQMRSSSTHRTLLQSLMHLRCILPLRQEVMYASEAPSSPFLYEQHLWILNLNVLRLNTEQGVQPYSLATHADIKESCSYVLSFPAKTCEFLY